MTYLTDTPEDPRGFLIMPDDPDEGTWKWQRIADNEEMGGFDSRADAIADAEGTPIREEKSKAARARAMRK